MADYIIAERRDLGENGLVAIPASIYSREAAQVYDEVGLMSGLNNVDFGKHGHWSFDYIPIEVIGSLKEPSEATKENLKKGLETICQSSCTKFDQTRLVANKDIASQILDYEVVDGDIYVVRFAGKELQEDKPFVRCLAYFVSPSDGAITLDGNQITLNNNSIDLPEGDLRFAIGYSGIEGTLEAFKAGSASIHRKNLKPYDSIGTYGGTHSNGPWIILQDKLDQERIDSIKSFMKLD